MALTTDDKLIKSESGSLVEVPITSITIESSDVEIVSIDVEEQDTYLVNGYVTHNKGANSHDDLAAPGAPSSITYTQGTDTLSWTAPSSVGTGGITAYDWAIDNNSDFSSPIVSATEWSATSIVVQASHSLSTGTYYFRVRAIDQGLAGTYGTLTFSYVAP